LKPEKNEEVEDWSLYISNGPITPVQHLAINLGAPGDKKGNDGTIWFGYPRPGSKTGLKFDINEEIMEGMGYYSYDSKNVVIKGTDEPWLFTNGCVGLKKCIIPLIDDLLGEEPGIFTVRLGLIPSSTRRKFSVKIQGQMVFENLDILKEAGSVNQAIIKEIKGVAVENGLTIEFVSANADPDRNQAPVINFIEILREDAPTPQELAKDNILLNTNQIKNLLVQAKEELGQKEFDKSLEKYQKVLNNPTSSRNYKIEALEGMGAVASTTSLKTIKKYLQKLDPIMWNYKEPDGELIDASVKVYVAIANNLGQGEKEKAINMLNHSLSLTSNPSVRKIAIQSLKDLGTSPEKKVKENRIVDKAGDTPVDSDEDY
jgi:hypothetical protein